MPVPSRDREQDQPRATPLLHSVRVLELGPALAGAVCGRMFAELGADVIKVDSPGSEAATVRGQGIDLALNWAKRRITLDLAVPDGRSEIERLAGDADLIVSTLRRDEMERLGVEPVRLQALNPRAVVVAITPFGLTGPYRDYRGGDLVAFHASGVARLLIGGVEDLEAEPPVRAAGEQSEFIAGITAACAAMHGVYARGNGDQGQLIDVSVQEAMACMSVRQLAAPAYGSPATSRRRELEGGGATVTVLPANDGHVVISPREDHQWQAWIGVLGSPAWASDPRFADRRSRVDHWQSLYPLMCDWSRQRSVHDIYDACQSSRVPCFPFGTPADMLASPQLEHRGFFRSVERPHARPLIVPGPPYGLPPEDYDSVVAADGETVSGGDRTDWWPRAGAQPRDHAAAGSRERRLPLEGTRVLDFSWIIAGPTCTRYLAAMGAEVIKVESADRPDPGRASALHDILGQSKAGLALNLKAPGALDVAKALVAGSDIVVENFAPGVMERLGLGYPALREVRPDVVLLSASGLGQSGPDAGKVAYGALLQCFTGFATLNGFPGRPPASGMAWADPMCGLVLAFAAVAALRDRDATGRGRHIDFSMTEALVSTMPGPLLDYQISGAGPEPRGNDDATHSPHGVYRCAGDDAWIAVAVTSDEEWRGLCREVESLAAMDALDAGERRTRGHEIDATLGEWALPLDAGEAMHRLQSAGVPASASFSSSELFDDPHLRARGFYRAVTYADGAERVLPGLPWRWGDGSLFEPAPAPALGGDTERVLRDVLALSEGEIEKLRTAGALS